MPYRSALGSLAANRANATAADGAPLRQYKPATAYSGQAPTRWLW